MCLLVAQWNAWTLHSPKVNQDHSVFLISLWKLVIWDNLKSNYRGFPYLINNSINFPVFYHLEEGLCTFCIFTSIVYPINLPCVFVKRKIKAVRTAVLS